MGLIFTPASVMGFLTGMLVKFEKAQEKLAVANVIIFFTTLVVSMIEGNYPSTTQRVIEFMISYLSGYVRGLVVSIVVWIVISIFESVLKYR